MIDRDFEANNGLPFAFVKAAVLQAVQKKWRGFEWVCDYLGCEKNEKLRHAVYDVLYRLVSEGDLEQSDKGAFRRVHSVKCE